MLHGVHRMHCDQIAVWHVRPHTDVACIPRCDIKLQGISWKLRGSAISKLHVFTIPKSFRPELDPWKSLPQPNVHKLLFKKRDPTQNRPDPNKPDLRENTYSDCRMMPHQLTTSLSFNLFLTSTHPACQYTLSIRPQKANFAAPSDQNRESASILSNLDILTHRFQTRGNSTGLD